MADITICVNNDFPLSYDCWRFNCPSKAYIQSYQLFKPTIDKNDNPKCEFHIPSPNPLPNETK